FNLYYGATQALKDISLRIPRRRVTAFIGPSGCGKSTLLRCFNRMNDLIDSVRIEGELLLHGEHVYEKGVDVSALRQRVGMVFQKPNPFPKSIYENVAYGLRLQGINKRRELDERVEWALRAAALWDEASGRRQDSAFGVSGGQRQRRVAARGMAVAPEGLRVDEPAAALDPISTLKIEEVIYNLESE